MNKDDFKECTSKTCVYGDDDGKLCGNRSMQRRKHAEVHVRQAAGKGHGLFAAKVIEPNSFIIEYVGEVIDDAEAAARLKRCKDEGDHNFYMMELKEDVTIDAGQYGNQSRFANHSCKPNAAPMKVKVNGVMRIGLFATQRIAAGQEITFDYQWINYAEKPWACLCGTECCRRTLGAKKKDEDDHTFSAALSGYAAADRNSQLNACVMSEPVSSDELETQPMSCMSRLPNMTTEDFNKLRQRRVALIGSSRQRAAGFRKSRTTIFRRGFSDAASAAHVLHSSNTVHSARLTELISYELNPADEDDEESFNDISCHQCANPGILSCCDFCKKSFHNDCSLDSETVGSLWKCHCCVASDRRSKLSLDNERPDAHASSLASLLL
jgi:histone-lysine N-methyltransferase SETD2